MKSPTKKHKHEETETLDRLQKGCLFTLWELKQDVSCLTSGGNMHVGQIFAALLMPENDQESTRVLVWGFKEILMSKQIQNSWLMRINWFGWIATGDPWSVWLSPVKGVWHSEAVHSVLGQSPFYKACQILPYGALKNNFNISFKWQSFICWKTATMSPGTHQ